MPATTPPAGTVRALLLTDVVDSTKLSEELGDAAMAALWAKHDRVARDLLVAHDGREIDKTDGFLMLFEEPAAAVGYAVAYHRALGELGIAARAGLHVGSVVLTENAPADVARGAKPLEVDGIAKPTAARVMSVATGGQTLLTEAAVEALGPTDLRLESHGHWRMKGVAEPLELFEVGDEGSPFTPPPDVGKVYRVVERDGVWLPAWQVPHSLPAERDAFVGRTDDLLALDRSLEGARLVSVLGIGGTGKTRLVTRYGWTWLGDYPGGVWFCDLSEARTLEGIAFAVGQALGVSLGEADPIEELGQAIADRGPCLVILDNFEQVSRDASATVGVWLDLAPEARFVVTTREILGLPGESALPLAPLRSKESVDLFIARARQAKPGFEPTDAASIEALVALLDHLPLAIELAAARVRVMPPKTLLERMSQRFKLLASRGGRHTRQATLRGALDWSWDLLEPDEQAALAQLSVLEGGFSLEAAEAVLVLEELWGMDAVQALVDKSLVLQIAEDRFDLLVSVQEYAAEKLVETGDRAAAEARHAAWFIAWTDGGSLQGLKVAGAHLRASVLARDLPNLVAACRRSAGRGDGSAAVALLRVIATLLVRTGPNALALELCEAVLSVEGLSGEEWGSVSEIRGQALMYMGRLDEATAQLERALAVVVETGSADGAFRVHRVLGVVYQTQSRLDEALEQHEACMAIARAQGSRLREAIARSNLGQVAHIRGKLDVARTHLEAGLAITRAEGDRSLEAVFLTNLCGLCFEQGRLDEALELATAALAVQRDLGNRRSESLVLTNLGSLHAQSGQIAEARAEFERALALSLEVGHLEGAFYGHANLGKLARTEERLDDAGAHYEAALGMARELRSRMHQGDLHVHLASLRARQGRTDDARAHLADGARLLRELDSPGRLALLLCVRVKVEVELGEVAIARAALTEAEALADQIGAPPSSRLGKELAEARAVLVGG